MFDKKILYIGGGVIVILLIVLVIFGFSGKKKSKKPSDNPNDANKLIVWDSFDDEYNFKDVFNQFENENAIQIDYVKKDPTKYETESVEALAAGNGPDVWIIPNNWMPKHHGKLSQMPAKTLDPKGKKENADIYKQTYVQAAVEDNVIDDQVYGFPLFMDSLALFYNPKLMQAKFDSLYQKISDKNRQSLQAVMTNPPKTWDDVVTFAKNYGENAIALGGSSKTESSPDILATLMLQYGAKMTSEDNTTALFQTAANQFSDNAYPGASALDFYTSFAKISNQNYTWNKDNDAYNDFANSKVAMMVNYSRMINSLIKNNDGLKVAALPQYSKENISLASYQTLTVPKSSQKQENAWKLISFLTSTSVSQAYLSITNLKSPLKKDPNSLGNDIDTQNQSATSWYNPDPSKVSSIFEGAINQVLGGNKAQTVLEGAAAQVTTLLESIKQ